MSEVLSHYGELITDPAHTLVELTFVLVVDVLFLGIVWPVIKRRINREHAVIDREHGVEHPATIPVRLSRGVYSIDGGKTWHVLSDVCPVCGNYAGPGYGTICPHVGPLTEPINRLNV